MALAPTSCSSACLSFTEDTLAVELVRLQESMELPIIRDIKIESLGWVRKTLVNAGKVRQE